MGWALGLFASFCTGVEPLGYVCTLLMFLGVRMIVEGMQGIESEEEKMEQRRHSLWLLITTAFAAA